MNIFGFLTKKDTIKGLKEQLRIAMDGMLRTGSTTYDRNANGHVYPAFPWGRTELKSLAQNSDTLTIVHRALRQEIFRNGYELIEADHSEEISEQEENVVEDGGKERKAVIEFMENCNANMQTVIKVMEETEDDLNIYDDSFTIFAYEYDLADDHEILEKELIEITRADPNVMGLVMNRLDIPAQNDEGQSLMFDITDRTTLVEGQELSRDGKVLYPAYFFTEYESDKKVYYAPWEVVHTNRYRPSRRLGFSPVLSAWQKIRTLIYMDYYIMRLYDGQRPPKAGLFFKTTNMDMLDKMWEKAKKRTQENPHMPTVMGVPDNSSGNGFVQFIDFMKPLNELQHTEMRNELRTQIGAVYGVMPLFQGDQSSSGGLNNEGLQVTVTNRAVEANQKDYNRTILSKILRDMKLFGWILQLVPSEEQDEMARLQRMTVTLANGEKAVNLGLVVKYDQNMEEIVIESGSLEKPVQEFSGFGTNPNPGQADISGEPLKSEDVVIKVDRIPSELEKKIRKTIERIFKGFTKRPTERQLKAALKETGKELRVDLKGISDREMDKVYKQSVEEVEKELDRNIIMGKIDENALKVLKNQEVLTVAYTGLSVDLSKKINDIISDAFKDPKGLSSAQITKRIQETSGFAESRAENIARTETGKVSSSARINSYKKQSDFKELKFTHIGPNDSRTTGTSKRIKDRTRSGVTWDQYVSIVKEESAKDFPTWTVNKDFPVSHWQSRHVFIAK